MITELLYLVALALATIELAKRKSVRLASIPVIAYTDLSHVALATLAANALTQGAPGIAASAVLTALYVTYQVVSYLRKGDTVDKDIAVYTATYAAVVATKLGLKLV